MPEGYRARSRVAGPARSLFVVEYALGHKTHARFLEQHLADDPRFAAAMIRLPRPGRLADLLARLQIPAIHRRGLDFWVWWLMQYKRQQLRRRLQTTGIDLTKLDLVYIHTQTAAAAVLDLPPNVPAVVSIDLTWKLVFREERYVDSPFFAPVYGLERRIYDRADVIVSFSEWAAASVVEDYGIPASKVAVVRNGVTLPTLAANGTSGVHFGPNGHGNGHAHGHGTGLGANGNGAYGATHVAHGTSGVNGRHGTASGANGGNGLLHVGFVGNQFLRKGGDLLLRVHQDYFVDDAHLTLVTSDPPRNGELRNVSIRSDVPWDELMTSVLPGFDVFAFPARYDYSPYAVIEAMSAGVPVIASRVGAIPEMIEDGVDGFLIDAGCEGPLAERMAWAIAHRSRLPEMGARARERAAAGYAAEQNYPQLLELLAAVAG